jgi:hypothetical protein
VWRKSDNTALLIFSTTTPTSTRLPTLMHNPQYRSQVAAQNAGYNQPPHPSFYLGYGMRAFSQESVHTPEAAALQARRRLQHFGPCAAWGNDQVCYSQD